MTPRGGNLFADLPSADAEEDFSELFGAPGIRIERIVSRAHASPPGFWYDQPQAEWVAVLMGHAELTIEGEATPRLLGPGDHVLPPAGCRHRVERTDDPTIWLAVHVG
jgi:cupin 2 domain-containing protein